MKEAPLPHQWQTGKWVYDCDLLTLPQLLSWIAAQGINRSIGERIGWNELLASMEWSSKLPSIKSLSRSWYRSFAGYFVLKATLDTAAGENPLPSIIAALFLMSLSLRCNSFKDGTPAHTPRPICSARSGTTSWDRSCPQRLDSPVWALL